MPCNIGYGSNKKTKPMLPSIFWRFLVHKVKKLEVLLMRLISYCAEIAQSVSFENCKSILERAALWGHQLPVLIPGCAGKKMLICMFYLCFNEITKAAKEKGRLSCHCSLSFLFIFLETLSSK
jgi:hypothetical protein